MKDPKALAQGLLDELKGTLGPRLEAFTLYGSAARGEWIPGLSDVNVLVLVDDIEPGLLARASSPAARAVEKGVRPLLMEREEWRRAWDVFAIEVADMRDAHVALHGDDPVAGAETHDGSLRLQAERELRAKLVQLHAGMLATADDKARLGDLLVRALPSFTAYLRAALRLAGGSAPRASEEAISAGCRVAGADPSAFLKVLEARRSGAGLRLALADPVVAGFNEAAERLAAHMDSLGGER